MHCCLEMISHFHVILFALKCRLVQLEEENCMAETITFVTTVLTTGQRTAFSFLKGLPF